MSKTKLTVDAGACRFKTEIQGTGSEDYMSAHLVIVSDCPNIKKLAEVMKTVDPMGVVSSRIMDNAVMKLCSEHIPHPACPVPCAIVKAVEVAGGLGVKKNVSMTFE